MSARRSPRKASRKSGREPFSTAIYVYCVGALEELAPLFEGDLPSPIQSPASLEVVAEGDLAAVVSAVPLADYGEEVIQERLSDPAWVAEHAMRHELVVEHFSRRANVIPLRFGTIYLSREAVGKMLGEKGRPLRATLVLLDGREEWGVNVYVDRAQLRQSVAEVSPRLREMREQADALSPGQAYLLRKKIDSLRDTEAGAERKRVASEIKSRLLKMSVGFGGKRLRANEKTEQGEVVGKFVFLLDRRKRGAFRSEAEKLAAEYSPLGFRLEMVGPWPPYFFAAFGQPVEEGEERILSGGLSLSLLQGDPT